MKVGFVTDTHFEGKNEWIAELLNDIADIFQEKGVDTVIHLGDIAHGGPTEAYTERVTAVADIFSEFDFHMTLGNHDVQAMSSGEFEKRFNEPLVERVVETEAASVIKMNSATTVTLPDTEGVTPVGHIPETGVDMVIEDLKQEKRVILCTHYPIQYTEVYQEGLYFDVRPEYTFPVNKSQFGARLMKADVDVSNLEMYCGHLHPDETRRISAKPFGIQMNIVEAIRLFGLSEDGDDIVWKENSGPEVNDLIAKMD